MAGSGINRVKNQFVKPQFSKDETKAIKIISEQFARDEIPVEQVIQKIKNNVSSDALEGVTPIEILADYGGNAVKRKLRGINIRVPGLNIGEKINRKNYRNYGTKGFRLSCWQYT